MAATNVRKSLLCAFAFLTCSACAVLADWSLEDGHKMHEPQLPDPAGWDICLIHQAITDDFTCSQTGPITDIHFWVSWRGDLEEFESIRWQLAIYEDLRGQPGISLWAWKEGDGRLVWRPAGEGDQGWYCPTAGRPLPSDHRNYYQVNITSISDAFHQEKGKTYWLCVAANRLEGKGEVGWKTSKSKHLKQALWLTPEHRWTAIGEMAYDLAFVITGESLDFGDAPDGAAAPGYPTLSGNNGASHVIGGPWLGDKNDGPDSEKDGQPDSNALGDDAFDGNDDEDGVTIPVLTAGVRADITVQVSGGGGVVEAWIDFDGDKKWEPVLEKVFGDFLPDGIYSIPITVPVNAVPGKTFARFRISSKGGLGPSGPANDGEVEDHVVTIQSRPAADYFEPNNRLQQAINLGYLGQKRTGLGINEPGEEDWFRWSALDDGILTVDVGFNRKLGKLKLELYDSKGNLLTGSESLADHEQIVYQVKAGSSYFTRVYSSDLTVHPMYDFVVDIFSESKNYAVLFAGGIRPYKNYPRYYNNTKNLYEILVNHFGLEPNNIWVLYADGNDPGEDLNTGGTAYENSDMSYAKHVLPATAANLETVLTETLANQAGINDHLFFWSFDHGGGNYNASGTTGEEYLCGWYEDISDEDMADWIDHVPARYKTSVFTQCFAGGMLDNLPPLSSTEFGCAATNHYESSWGDGFAAAFNDGLEVCENTYDVYQYAYSHDAYANDGEGPGGSVANSREHPWAATTRNFPIFAEEEDNSPPLIITIRPIKYVPPWEEVTIPFDLLLAAADIWDPDGGKVAFRIESVDAGLLRKGGDPVVPGETVLGFGESLQLQGPQAMAGPESERLEASGEPLDAFTVRAFDGATISDHRIAVPIQFVEAGGLPSAEDDLLDIDEDAKDAPVPVLDNDQGAGELSVVSVGEPLHGRVSIIDGEVHYTPSPEFSGTDSFSYFMADSTEDTDWAVVHVTVHPINDPTEAYYDEFIVAPNSRDNVIDVLANDFDPESKPLTYDLESGPYSIAAVLIEKPSHGTLTPRANGTFLYTPDAGFIGDDSFTYKANDGENLSNEAAVTIHVLHKRAVKWIQQLPDETKNGIDIRADSSDGILRTLADDFECTSCGLLTDVVLWGSWKYDKKGQIKKIHLSIHADDPIGPEGTDPENLYSKPDKPLWEKDFFSGKFEEQPHATVEPGEYWWDPITKEFIQAGDRQIWRIHIEIVPADAFRQKGSRRNPVIYWLDVEAETENGQFGWKTRRWPQHYNDDAVIAVGPRLPRPWQELRYPLGHPYHTLEFEDLPFDARYYVGDTLTTSGIAVYVKRFQWATGAWTDAGHTRVVNIGRAGGSGHELNVNNANLEFAFPSVLPELILLFGEYGGNCNIEINGDFRNFANFSQINGITIGGVEVAVVNGFGNDTGSIHLRGMINQFAIGGQELYIDQVKVMNSVDMAFVLFTNPCVEPWADFNSSGKVEMNDVAFFTEQWLLTGLPDEYIEGDLDCDGSVKFIDFAILTTQWLQSLP
jgi:hypothetical protein